LYRRQFLGEDNVFGGCAEAAERSGVGQAGVERGGHEAEQRGGEAGTVPEVVAQVVPGRKTHKKGEG
jgi:hypothetical protein